MNCRKALSTAIFVLAAVFIAAAAIRLVEEKNDAAHDTDNEYVEEVPVAVTGEEGYLLIAEENYLNLYDSVNSGALKLSEKLNTSIFPEEDIAQLRKGIVFDDEKEAYEMMENFIY